MSKDEYVIPMNPYGPVERIVPWKEGEQEALARGISARKHRETAARLWSLKNNPYQFQKDIHPEKFDLIYAPPKKNPLYKVAMDAIRSHQGRFMQVELLTVEEEQSLEAIVISNPADMYVIMFLREELIEKGWLRTAVRFQHSSLGPQHGGTIILESDFRLQEKEF